MRRRYNTIMVEVAEDGDVWSKPKTTTSITGYSIKEQRFEGVVIEADTDDAQHAEMIADPDIYEQVVGPVPDFVSGAQAKMALHSTTLQVAPYAGINALVAAEALIASPATPDLFKIFWHNTEVFERRSPAINAIGNSLGLTQDDIEAMFVLAKTIHP